MSLVNRDRTALWQWTAAWYEADRQDARRRGHCVSYRLEDLRSLVERALAEGKCRYCKGALTARNVAIDHPVPIARGGRFSFRNLEVCCAPCGAMKWPLDSQEFRALLHAMANWPKPIQRDFRDRLVNAASECGRSLPALDSLEWFTGLPETLSAAFCADFDEVPGCNALP